MAAKPAKKRFRVTSVVEVDHPERRNESYAPVRAGHRITNRAYFEDQGAATRFADRLLAGEDDFASEYVAVVYVDQLAPDSDAIVRTVRKRVERRRPSSHHATARLKGPAKKSSAQLDREIAEVLTKPRAHATKRDASNGSLWAEVGLEDASSREKAAFWREALLSDLGDVDAMGVSSSLRPVLADISEVVDPEVLRAFARNQLDAIASSDYREAVREIREQILNASIGQIVQYANEHYRSLP